MFPFTLFLLLHFLIPERRVLKCFLSLENAAFLPLITEIYFSLSFASLGKVLSEFFSSFLLRAVFSSARRPPVVSISSLRRRRNNSNSDNSEDNNSYSQYLVVAVVAFYRRRHNQTTIYTEANPEFTEYIDNGGLPAEVELLLLLLSFRDMRSNTMISMNSPKSIDSCFAHSIDQSDRRMIENSTSVPTPPPPELSELSHSHYSSSGQARPPFSPGLSVAIAWNVGFVF